MKKKKSIIAIVCAISMLSLSLVTGCDKDSFTTTMSVETSNSSEASMKYKSFDGTKTYHFNVPEGETRTVSVNVETEKGKLNATIEKDGNGDDNEEVYRGTDIPTSDFKVDIKKSGDYTIYLEASKHSGSYSFQWK